MFRLQTHGVCQVLQCPSWPAPKITHGFIGSSSDFSSASLASAWPAFSEAFNVPRLLLLRQVHGIEVYECEAQGLAQLPLGVTEVAEADAMILNTVGLTESVAIGVRTADCLPILACAGSWLAVIHAGWRGLAGGVCEAALKTLAMRSQSEIVAIVGPCAGRADYEVGAEVIEALQPDTVSMPSASGKNHELIDLCQTLVLRMKRLSVNVSFHCSNMSTISNPVWHSFRRNGATAGRNLGFLVVPRNCT